MREPWECLEASGRILDRLDIRWAVMGALAAERYRDEKRFTTDADLLIDGARGVIEAFEAEGYRVNAMAEPGGDPYVIYVRGKGDRLDLIVAETEFQLSALDRAVDHVITAEDLVVFKLIAWRGKDRDDVESILRTGRQLDVAYIERWAREWEVFDRWEEVRRRHTLES